LGVEGAFGS
jgi:hypothetical protein